MTTTPPLPMDSTMPEPARLGKMQADSKAPRSDLRI
jgi:hypothetical protein